MQHSCRRNNILWVLLQRASTLLVFPTRVRESICQGWTFHAGMVEVEWSVTGRALKELHVKSPLLASSGSGGAHLPLSFIFWDFKFRWVSWQWVISSGNSHCFSRVDIAGFQFSYLKPTKQKCNTNKNLETKLNRRKPYTPMEGFPVLLWRGTSPEGAWCWALPKSSWRKNAVLHIWGVGSLAVGCGTWAAEQSKLSSVAWACPKSQRSFCW